MERKRWLNTYGLKVIQGLKGQFFVSVFNVANEVKMKIDDVRDKDGSIVQKNFLNRCD